jgi:hypothetical protein
MIATANSRRHSISTCAIMSVDNLNLLKSLIRQEDA